MTSRSTGSGAGTRLLRAYPRWWRDRYADEMSALLEARPPDLGARIDLLRGAFDAHLRGAGSPPGGVVAAALIAGGVWTIAGVASMGAPMSPDWPFYLATTMPLVFVGAVAILIASIGVARQAWASSGPGLEVAVVAVVVGHLAWAGALALATLGGPYGAITAIAQSVAAIATVGLGLVLLRARVHPVGEAVLVAGGVFLLPTPASWLVAGALWTGIGLWRSTQAPSDDAPPAAPA